MVAPYPFSTRTPLPGMVPFENVQIQLIDLPPIAPETAEPWLFALIRQADGALLVADLASDDLLSSMEETLTLLERFNVRLGRGGAPSEGDGDPGGRGGSEGAGASEGGAPEGAASGSVPTILVAAKADAPGAEGRLDILRELCAGRWPILAVSAETGVNVDALRAEMFRLLDVIRVYTKARGRRADLSVPFVLKRGTTVQDAAAVVHKDFADRLKYARIWGTRMFEGQMVQREHVLEDGDILELHA